MMFDGFELEDIDEVARELKSVLLEDLGCPPKLAVLALCRVIAVIGTSDDLDVACKNIDDMAGIEETLTDYDEDAIYRDILDNFEPDENDFN